jgi:hypothetical protein
MKFRKQIPGSGGEDWLRENRKAVGELASGGRSPAGSRFQCCGQLREWYARHSYSQSIEVIPAAVAVKS